MTARRREAIFCAEIDDFPLLTSKIWPAALVGTGLRPSNLPTYLPACGGRRPPKPTYLPFVRARLDLVRRSKKIHRCSLDIKGLSAGDAGHHPSCALVHSPC